MRKFLEALAVWIVVAIVVWLLAKLLLAVDANVTHAIGSFLEQTNVVIGFLAGLWHYFFGFRLDRRV